MYLFLDYYTFSSIAYFIRPKLWSTRLTKIPLLSPQLKKKNFLKHHFQNTPTILGKLLGSKNSLN